MLTTNRHESSGIACPYLGRFAVHRFTDYAECPALWILTIKPLAAAILQGSSPILHLLQAISGGDSTSTAHSLSLQLTELEGKSQHGEAGQDRVDADYPEDRQQACPRTGEQEETDDDR